MSAEPQPLAASREPRAVAKPRSRKRLALVLVLTLGLVTFGIWYFVLRAAGPNDDTGRFQGEWQLAVLAVDRDGKPAARRTTTRIRVTGDRWVWLVGEHEQKQYTMTLRPDAEPKEIDLAQLATDGQPLIQKWPPPAQPVMLRGIYTIEGGQAKIVTSVRDEPRPTRLDATDGTTVWLLERVE